MINFYNYQDYRLWKYISCLFVSCDTDQEREETIEKTRRKYPKSFLIKVAPYKNIDWKMRFTFRLENVVARDIG